ncbi:Inorganic pyrophosphatase [Nocardiopsis sp. NPDC006938]|uniref:Inorganic pyrophosphatase n=1 Tax=Nocardiopsis sp. NPDC006938 TaxID=3364337 RepID=UPI0036B81A10
MPKEAAFWYELDRLVEGHTVRIDRPRGSSHPRFEEYVYPVDYGYLDETRGGDGEGVDIWVGSGPSGVVGAVATVDPMKKDAEIKILHGCTTDEVTRIEEFYVPQPQAAVIIRRGPEG